MAEFQREMVSLSPFQAALLRAVLWSPRQAAWGRPFHRLWRCSGQDPRRWAGSRPLPSKKNPLGTETEKFQMVYRFDAIRVFGYLSQLKVAQTA